MAYRRCLSRSTLCHEIEDESVKLDGWKRVTGVKSSVEWRKDSTIGLLPSQCAYLYRTRRVASAALIVYSSIQASLS